jgi:tyrosyl-tRNA synthetase
MLNSINSKFLAEFVARGFFQQATHFNELDNLATKEKLIAYIGFDCTAKSLHIGSLLQIMVLRLLQKHNHQVIILLGGGTTKIGDPSGKDESRQVLSEEQINENLNGIKKTLSQFISFEGENKAIIVNNDSWLANLNYIEFLRDIGKYFSINRMLSFDSVKLRLDRDQPLSFLEFNYMILQAFDFYQLNKTLGCNLQIGGSDQWGNIVNGVELVRKINASKEGNKEHHQATFGLTTPLMTTADGKKMGKTANGAVWLSAEMLSPFDYFQYFRNIADDDVIRFLKLFSEIPLEEINKMSNWQNQELNQAKEILAFEATKICHGEEQANIAKKQAEAIFSNKNINAFIEKSVTQLIDCKITEIIKEIGETGSLSEAKRLIEGKAVKLNQQIVTDFNYIITAQDLEQVDSSQNILLQIGKKKFFQVKCTNSKN